MQISFFTVYVTICLVIIIGGLIVIGRYYKNNKEYLNRFDDRQKMARGQAYKYAFFAVLTFAVINAVLYAFDIIWCGLVLAMIIEICLGITVFSVVVICKDADDYSSKNSNLAWIPLSMFLLIQFAGETSGGKTIVNGVLNDYFGILFFVISFWIIWLVHILYRIKKKYRK